MKIAAKERKDPSAAKPQPKSEHLEGFLNQRLREVEALPVLDRMQAV